MKTITISLDKNEKVQYELSIDVSTQDYKSFKLNHKFMLEKILSELYKGTITKSVVDFDKLPELCDDFDDLKRKLLSHSKHMNIVQYNELREQAKMVYTFPVICELDASGLVKKLTR